MENIHLQSLQIFKSKLILSIQMSLLVKHWVTKLIVNKMLGHQTYFEDKLMDHSLFKLNLNFCKKNQNLLPQLERTC